MELEPLNAAENLKEKDLKSKLAEKDASENVTERDRWGSRVEFLFAIIGYTVGIGSIWRFPILCARNGGGAFIIPFFFFMITCGGPLYYIEVCLGQFSGQSAGSAFEFCPLFRDSMSGFRSFTRTVSDLLQSARMYRIHALCVGFLMVLISFNMMWYYVSIMGWIQYYFVQSFQAELPWSKCGNWWNTGNCKETNLLSNASVPSNGTFEVNVSTGIPNISMNESLPTNTSMLLSPATEFWLYNVLRKSDGLEDMGTMQWHLVLSNFVALVLVVASLIKGVKSLGKVVYVTATAPYVLLTVLLIRGLTLDGAVDGILWYITPDFEKLALPQVWLQAAIQVFYSLGPTYGGVITMASHNKFHQKSLLETTICVVADAFTAFYAGLVVFTSIGFMAKEAGTSVEDAARVSGPGLAFVAYPEVITRLPLPQLWAVLFFFTLITVAFDTMFTLFETITGTLLDVFPKQLLPHKYLVLIGTAILFFILGLPFSMSGGIYLFQLSDWYVTAYALMFGSAFESIMVCWIYGADRFAEDITLMTGRKVSKLLRICWCIIMTGFLSITCIVIIITYSKPNYGDSYEYKPYAIAIGMAISMIPFVPVVGIMIKEIWEAEGSIIQRIRKLLQPSSKWQPIDQQARKIYRFKPYRYKDTLCKRIRVNIVGNKNTPWI